MEAVVRRAATAKSEFELTLYKSGIKVESRKIVFTGDEKEKVVSFTQLRQMPAIQPL